MKKLLYALLFVVLLLSCKGREKISENDLFSTNFQNYKEISAFENYQKVSDTSISTAQTNDDFRLLHLKKDREMVILFYKVVNRDVSEPAKFEYAALDTLMISDLKPSQRFTIGYCTKAGLVDEQIIAVVEDTTGLYMEVVRAWAANLETQEIEVLSEASEIKCLNEFHEMRREEPLEPDQFPKQ